MVRGDKVEITLINACKQWGGRSRQIERRSWACVSAFALVANDVWFLGLDAVRRQSGSEQSTAEVLMAQRN